MACSVPGAPTWLAQQTTLREAGSDESRLLSATVYLTDISKKDEMNEVWNAWICPEHWPQRACVQVGLSPGVPVEITVIAARSRPTSAS